jgi:hypothetical protein
MKIVQVETLISCGRFAKSAAWKTIRRSLHRGIKKVDWPKGSGKFTIFPESGKRRGKGNGVVPIKTELILELVSHGWKSEERVDIPGLGKFDAIYECAAGAVAFEWETGNISSSHRALNKMALGLLKKLLVAGTLVVPSRNLYQYLTDRIGNFRELQPYLELWKSFPCQNGVLEIVVIEHDATSTQVPRIPKITAGRALQ